MNKNGVSKTSATVLVVDDEQNINSLIIEILAQNGYETLSALDGNSALAILHNQTVDLVMLDIKLPDIGGYDVCKKMKKNPDLAAIPVIFLSALNELNDKVRAFSSGGVDYISKPFQPEEIIARVQTHLAHRKAEQDLARQNAELRELNREKQEFISIAAHDLVNPLSVIKGLADLLAENADKLSPEDSRSYLRTIAANSTRMHRLVKNLLDANAIESGTLSTTIAEVSVAGVVAQAVDNHRRQSDEKNVSIKINIEATDLVIKSDESLLIQILDNLISNALKFSPAGGIVEVTARKQQSSIFCTIADSGPGISEDAKEKLFGKFNRLSPQITEEEGSTGLGLYIVRKLVRYLRGSVQCESEPGRGSKFIIELPTTFYQ